MAGVDEIRSAQRAKGTATILAIGTATPPNIFYQAKFPDYYFRVTKSEHMTELKDKFKRMCEKSMIYKRHLYLTEDMLKKHPNLCEYEGVSIGTRQDIVVPEVPRLGKDAALKAIKEWGQPKSKITHVIVSTSSGNDMPGPDYKLCKLLGLSPSVRRIMLYQQGCYAGGTALRLAKDIAENNYGARVLIVCSEITAYFFRGPSEVHVDSMIGQALCGDGAASVIVGADPDESIERPIYRLVWTGQTMVHDSEGALEGHLRESGLTLHLCKDVPSLVSNNIADILTDAFSQYGISDWNSLFWIVHPGGRAILDQIEDKLGLQKEKLVATRNILRDYGNLGGASVLFILDEMRKKSLEEGHSTTGQGLDWGVLLGTGHGLTMETVVLHSVPLHK